MRNESYVVYVDDDPDDRMFFKEGFNSIKDYDLLTLVNGFELLLYLKQRSTKEMPRLIVLDINMPVMDGMEALSLLKNNDNYKDIPVVMFSTSSNPTQVAYCKDLNTDFFIKPTKYGEIKNIVQDLLKYTNGPTASSKN